MVVPPHLLHISNPRAIRYDAHTVPTATQARSVQMRPLGCPLFAVTVQSTPMPRMSSSLRGRNARAGTNDLESKLLLYAGKSRPFQFSGLRHSRSLSARCASVIPASSMNGFLIISAQRSICNALQFLVKKPMSWVCRVQARSL